MKSSDVRWPLAWVLAVSLSIGLPALAHEEKDPVCGMMVEIEKAHAKETFAGQAFFFCGPSCVDTFRANAEKYVGALRVFEMRGDLAVVMTARPRLPKPGDLVRYFIQVGPPEKGGMVPDPKTLRRLRKGVAYIYRVDRGSRPEPDVRRLHETEEPGTYGFSKLIEADGEYRVYFEATYEGGKEIRVGLDSVTPGAMPKADHHGPEPAAHAESHAGHSQGSPGGSLSMAAQHDTMKRMGERWLALGTLLERPGRPERRAEAAGHLDEIERWAQIMPAFKLHKFDKDKDEFLKLTHELRDKLSGLRAALPQGEAAARKSYREVEGTSCLKCHLKFRWGVASDLGRFPDLSGQP